MNTQNRNSISESFLLYISFSIMYHYLALLFSPVFTIPFLSTYVIFEYEVVHI